MLAAVLCAAPAKTQKAPASGGWRTPWSYEDGAIGPTHWATLDPDYAACGTGREQSPIDIASATKAELPPIKFSYQTGAVRIINNGYTAVRVNYPRGNGNYLYVGDTRYELTQFHFHHPSEEYVHGAPSVMAAHFMHASSDGKVVGVTVLLRVGKSNAVVGQLWPHMPQTAGAEHEVPGLAVDPSGLLPRELGYYMYAGSQTAPPCTEGVTWYVLKTPMEISQAEVDAFAKLYPHDVRPPQPLNGRVVRESR
ncbi:MAG TPA: carbonic anhydrase family protein [Gemmatimonadaceae bacterium]|jgi:carbonic anhydrase